MKPTLSRLPDGACSQWIATGTPGVYTAATGNVLFSKYRYGNEPIATGDGIGTTQRPSAAKGRGAFQNTEPREAQRAIAAGKGERYERIGS